uniref:Uncharacterized protein n=1 Tax=Timema genevievae TaxID=629358 RepID=A0A7R9PIG0_TIMGE|nr:unnamed protein product [Timema genevievae]
MSKQTKRIKWISDPPHPPVDVAAITKYNMLNLIKIYPLNFQKLYSDFELQGVMEDKLNSKTYQTISQRMQTEEATCALTMSSRNDNEDSEDYPDTGLDDDGDRSKPKVTIRETLGEDGNYVAKITNVTTNVVGRVGNMFGKGIGGLTSKFGGGSWF